VKTDDQAPNQTKTQNESNNNHQKAEQDENMSDNSEKK